MLRRLGNKSKIAHKIQEYFPVHSVYIELFFGAGGMFFNKPKVQYNFLNDLDNDVYNLFMVLKNNSDELYEFIRDTPKHESIFKNWLKNEEATPIWKAVRFLYLSNYSLYGDGATLRSNLCHDKKSLIKNIISQSKIIQDVIFFNSDFRNIINKIGLSNKNDHKKCFIYSDPPYINSTNRYSVSFNENDSNDLFDILCNSGIKFAMSEFRNDFTIKQAMKRNLNVVEIQERKTLKSRNTEILVMNYDSAEGRLF